MAVSKTDYRVGVPSAGFSETNQVKPLILVHTVDSLLTAIDLVAAVLALGRSRALQVAGDT